MIHVSVFVGCWRFVNMWRKLLRWSLRIVCLAWLAYLSGCVAYIEIQPAETLPNRRPYIRVIDPDIDMITLDSNSRTKIEFKLQVGDISETISLCTGCSILILVAKIRSSVGHQR